MAAKGLVPLGPSDLVTVLYQLAHDPDPGVLAAANEKCGTLPDTILEGALGGELDQRVLDFYADRFRTREKILEILVLNTSIADETVARMAKRSSENISEVIATNEQRLLNHPKIIENLYSNKNARMSTVNRAIELAVRNKIVLEGIGAFKEVAVAIREELIVDEPGGTPQDREFAETMALGEDINREASPEQIEEELQEATPQSEKKELAYKRVAKMSTVEKIRASDLEPTLRPYLIRDNNKLVALAAIKSKGITDTEVLAYARNKNLPEEVVRHIANKKNWTKQYSVKKALVENPKAPLPRALSFLIHLREHDIRKIARSKNVPASIAQAAKNHLKKRSR